MQLLVFIIVCMWIIYSSQMFMFSPIKVFVNNMQKMVELPTANITTPRFSSQDLIKIPKLYFDDVHQIIMLFP